MNNKEQIKKIKEMLVQDCPFVDKCVLHCNKIDRDNCWGKMSENIADYISSLIEQPQGDEKGLMALEAIDIIDKEIARQKEFGYEPSFIDIAVASMEAQKALTEQIERAKHKKTVEGIFKELGLHIERIRRNASAINLDWQDPRDNCSNIFKALAEFEAFKQRTLEGIDKPEYKGQINCGTCNARKDKK
jgi:hypothetical protein